MYYKFVLLFALVLTMSSATIVKNKDRFQSVAPDKAVNSWDDFYKYVGRATKYPADAQRALLQGTTMIKFSVVNGLIENLGVVVELGGGCDAAAMKGISSYKGYKEIKDGDYTLKFTFVLSETNTPRLNANIEPLKGYTALDDVTVKAFGGIPKSVMDDSVKSDIKVYDYFILERKPAFEGGMGKFQSYLKKSIFYPERARRKGIEGKAFLSFIVEVDGSITNIKVERSLDAELDEEAVRVIKESPKWIPGMNKGKILRVKFNTSIPFTLE